MSQLEMREEIAKARFDVKEKSKQMATLQREYKDEVKELKREMSMLQTALRKVTSERDHYKTAFTQMYKEKKARDEKAI
jgi:F0F1-type ATP synthase membrane subunit b/b'